MEPCIFCQGTIAPTTRRCQQCGRTQSQPYQAAPVQSAGLALFSIACPNCGDSLPRQARFCGSCGQPITPSLVASPPGNAGIPTAGTAVPQMSPNASLMRRVSASLASLRPAEQARKPLGFQGNIVPLFSDVFISYSRKDKAFVQQMAKALEAAKRQAWVDWQDIPPTAKWLEEIYAGIEASTTFIFILSPDSIVSKTCMQEVAHAVEFKKRIIPLVCHRVDPMEVIEPLRELNWIFFTPQDRFDEAFQELLFALDTDLAYWHQAARLLTYAKDWENKGRNAGLTLRGQELREAERWLAEGATKQPSPNKLQTEFITASRRATNTRQRRTISGLSVVSVVLAASTILSFILYQLSQTQKAQIQQQLTVTQAHQYAAEANAALFRNQAERALLFGVKSYNTYNDLETRDALYDSITEDTYLDAIFTDETPLPSSTLGGYYMDDAIFNPVEHTLISISHDGRVMRWDPTTHQQRLLFQVQGSTNRDRQIWLSPDGSKLVLFAYKYSPQYDTTLQLRNVSTGALLWDSSLGLGNRGFLGHYTLAFNPDGTNIVVASSNSDESFIQISKWRVSNGHSIGKPLVLPQGSYRTMSLSPDGTRLATIDNSSQRKRELSIKTWDTSGHVLWQASTAMASLVTLNFSPNGAKLLSAEQNKIQIRDAKSGTSLAGFSANLSVVNAGAFSPDGKRVALGGCSDLGCTQGKILLLTVDAPGRASPSVEASLAGHINGVLFLSFSPDGSQIVSIDGSNHLFLWKANATSFYHRFAPPTSAGENLSLEDLSFSPDGKYLAAGVPVSLRGIQPGAPTILWNVADGKVVATFPATWAPLFSPDGKYFAAYTATAPSSTNPFAGLSLTLFDLTTQKVLRSFGKDTCVMTDANFKANLRFSPDGKELLEPCLQNNPARAQINIWDINSGKPVQQELPGSDMILKDSPNQGFGMKISSDTQVIAMSAGQSLNLWRRASGQQSKLSLHQSQGQQIEIVDFSFSPDSRTLATLDETGTTILWDLSTEKQIGSLNNKQSNSVVLSQEAPLGKVIFSPDGNLLVSILGNSGTIAYTTKPQLPLFLDIPYLTPVQNGVLIVPWVGDLAFSPDGRFLAWTSAFIQSDIITARDLNPYDWVLQACQILGLSLQDCTTAPNPA
jgi:WD40 repeat protein